MFLPREIKYKHDKIKDKFYRFPVGLIAVVYIISFIGVISMISASQGDIESYAKKHLIHIALFTPILIIVALTDLRLIFRFSYIFYFIAVLLLLIVVLFGHKAMGATRWINLGFIKIQPTELAKLAIILALARYFHDIDSNRNSIKDYLIPVLMIIVPAILILKQPDLGSTIICLAVAISIFFISGLNIWWFVFGIATAITSMPIIWKFLHTYQKQRILTFLNPESDPLGSGYNIIQSKIAIGSGGFFGKGFLKGTQTQLNFLPEQQTDFVFTILLEEFGFLGGTVTIVLFAFLIIYCLFIAINARSNYGKFIVFGITSMLFTHIFINIAMIMGMLPVVGNPLPFLSSGGTMLLSCFISIGMIINIHVNQNIYISKQQYII